MRNHAQAALRRCLVVLLTSLASCEAGEPVGRGPPASQPALWRLADTAEFLNPGGAFAGDSVFFLGVLDGGLSPNGDAVVTLGRTANTVVFIDASGQIAQVLGGRGDGPNEFSGAPRILRASEQLFVLDSRRGRIRALGRRSFGEPRRFEPIARHSVLGVLDDGTVVMEPTSLVRFDEGRDTVLASTPYLLLTSAKVDTLPGPAAPTPPAFPVTPTSSLFVRECLPTTHYAIAGSKIIIADASVGLLMSLDRSGAIDTLYHSTQRSMVTQEMVGAGLSLFEDLGEPGQREAFLERLGQVGDPLQSVWSALLWDGRSLWLQHAYPCFDSDRTEAHIWDVIDIESGSRVATLQTPANLRLLAHATDRVLGVFTDELGVEYVGVYRIIR
jgi:hypothetical protein